MRIGNRVGVGLKAKEMQLACRRRSRHLLGDGSVGKSVLAKFNPACYGLRDFRNGVWPLAAAKDLPALHRRDICQSLQHARGLQVDVDFAHSASACMLVLDDAGALLNRISSCRQTVAVRSVAVFAAQSCDRHRRDSFLPPIGEE